MAVVLIAAKNALHDLILDVLNKRSIPAKYYLPQLPHKLPPRYDIFETLTFFRLSLAFFSAFSKLRDELFVVVENMTFAPTVFRVPTLFISHYCHYPLALRRMRWIFEECSNLVDYNNYVTFKVAEVVHTGLKHFANKHTYIHVAHESIADFLSQHYPKVSFPVIHYPVRIDAQPKPLSERKGDVLIIGRYWKVASIAKIVAKIIKELVNRGLRVTYKDYSGTHAFATRAMKPSKSKYTDVFQRAGAKVLKGVMPRAEYIELINDHKVSLIASAEETFGVRIAEQMALSPAVSITDDFWFESLIKVPPSRVVDEILNLLSSVELWEEKLVAQREEVLKYTYELTHKDVENVVDNVIAKYVSPRGDITKWM